MAVPDNRENEKTKKYHSLTLENRNSISMTGIVDLIDFSDTAVTLVTPDGNLSVEGSDIHISVLDIDKGEMAISGKFDSVCYFETKSRKKKGLFGRSSGDTGY